MTSRSVFEIRAGVVIVALSVLLAGLWWSGAAALAMNADAPAGVSFPVLFGLAVLAVVPGLAMILAGWIGARFSHSAAAGEAMIEAANALLTPDDGAMRNTAAYVQEVSGAVGQLNQDIEDAHAGVLELSGDLTKSAGLLGRSARMVRSHGSAVVEGLTGHCETLAETSRTLAEQTDKVEEAVSRHSETVTAAAQAAAGEIQRAEDSLNTQALTMEEAAERLTAAVAEISRMTKDGRKRSMALTYALNRVSRQMDASAQNVEAAVKAGELAVEASKGTADALTSAVSDALDRAISMTGEIESRSAEAGQEAEAALARIARARQALNTADNTPAFSIQHGHARAGELPSPMRTDAPTLKIVQGDRIASKSERTKIALDDVFGQFGREAS